MRKSMRIRSGAMTSAIGSCAVLWLGAGIFPALAADGDVPLPVKIAVFDFELEDVSAAASKTGESARDSERMQAVSGAARRALLQSGRYSLIETHGVDAEPVRHRSLRTCNGCEAAIGLKLGAEESLIGVVTRVAQTEYYVSLRITDTKTGKVVNEQAAFFTGADDAWASGVGMLIRHGVLTSEH